MDIISVPSPNYLGGRNGYNPEAIVIHIMEGSLSGTDSWFQSTVSQVSAHYGVGISGEIHQYVKETDTAWHAGRVNAPSWQLIKPAGNGLYINPNFYTIGIEHEGNDNSDWTDDMYATSSTLIKGLCSRWKIPIDRDHIIGHHEIYSLKTCPGYKVDLNKLIALAAGNNYLQGTTPQITEQSLKLTTATRLNIRPAPNKNYAPIALVEPGIQLAADGYTGDGENINGISKWFCTNEGSWFWAGGVK